MKISASLLSTIPFPKGSTADSVLSVAWQAATFQLTSAGFADAGVCPWMLNRIFLYPIFSVHTFLHTVTHSYVTSVHYIQTSIYFPQFHTGGSPPTPPDMCIRVVEKYPGCGCIYYVHAVDACRYYGRHPVVDKIIYVGLSCQDHSG